MNVEKEKEKTTEELIHAIPLQMVKPGEYELNDKMDLNEPQISALEDLSDLDEDEKRKGEKEKEVEHSSPQINLTYVHIENIKAKMEELRRQDPRIIALLRHGMVYETSKYLSNEDLDHLLRKRKEKERKTRDDKRKFLNMHLFYLKHCKYFDEQLNQMTFKETNSLIKALKAKEDENEKKRVELRAMAELERKVSVLRRFDGKPGFLVEHGVGFDIVEQ